MSGASQTKKVPRVVKANFRLSGEEFNQLAELAKVDGITMSELIRQMIRERHRHVFGMCFQCWKCKVWANFKSTVEAMSAGWVKTPVGWFCPKDVRGYEFDASEIETKVKSANGSEND